MVPMQQPLRKLKRLNVCLIECILFDIILATSVGHHVMTACRVLHLNNIHGTNAMTIAEAKMIKYTCLTECILFFEAATSVTPIAAINITAATR